MSINTILRTLYSLAYIPHYILFLNSKSRGLIEKDLKVNGEKRHSKMYAGKE